MSKKVYEGTRSPNDDFDISVVVKIGASVYQLKHDVKHSPSGVEWGYGGAGPYDLARSILSDFCRDIKAEGWCESNPLFRLCNDDYFVDNLAGEFLHHVVSVFPRAHWELTQDEIENWILQRSLERR